MPEGDTIHRTAATLGRALAGRTIARFAAPRLVGPMPDAGTLVEGVEARGKHCIIRFGDGSTLRTHMRMTGSWHLYRPGQRWRRRPAAARVVIEVDGVAGEDPGWVAVCFAAPEVELTRRAEPPLRRPGPGAPAGPGRSGALDAAVAGSASAPAGTGHLGPDLCVAGADVDEAVRRLGRYSDAGRPIGDALLDQRIACGVGNVFRCEVLFIERLDPAAPVEVVDADTRRRLLACAHRLLLANLALGRRVTWRDGHAVYGRAGEACPRCGTEVRCDRQGRDARLVWWCPGCQVRPGSTPVAAR